MNQRIKHTLIATTIAMLAAVTFALPASANSLNASPVPELIDVSPALADTPAGRRLVDLTNRFAVASTGAETTSSLEIAKQIVSTCSRIWGESSPQVAKALTNLAIAQAGVSDFVSAEENFLSAIRIHEDASGGIVSDALMNPLRGLAATMVATNQTENAVPVYERAIHVSHVNLGPNNTEQLGLLDALSRAYYELGEFQSSNEVQNNLYQLQLRNFSRDSDQFLDALLGRARWFSKVGNFNAAMRAYKSYVGVAIQQYGENDKRLIGPLVELAFSSDAPGTEYNPGDLSAEAQLYEKKRAMKHALKIAEFHSAEDPVLYAQTLAKDGDLKVSLAGNARFARVAYRQAWDILSESPELEVVRKQMFGRPMPVRQIPLRRVPGGGADSASVYRERGFVELVYDVNALGRPINVRVSASNPPGLLDSRVIRGFKLYRFRPAFENGQPVEATNLTFRHDFRYADERLTPNQRDRIAEAEAEAEINSSDSDNVGDIPVAPVADEQ